MDRSLFSYSSLLVLVMLLSSSLLVVWCTESAEKPAEELKEIKEEQQVEKPKETTDSWTGWAKDKISGGLHLKQAPAEGSKVNIEHVVVPGDEKQKSAVEKAEEALEEAKSKAKGTVTDAVREAEQQLLRAKEMAVPAAKHTFTHQEEEEEEEEVVEASHATGGGAVNREEL